MGESVSDQRVDWIDYAKGICIVAVVSFYATFYVQDMGAARRRCQSVRAEPIRDCPAGIRRSSRPAAL
jgi:hypothetical protein